MKLDLEQIEAQVGKVAAGAPADPVLAEVCKRFEMAHDGTIAGVTILDADRKVFEHAIFPSLADTYADALQGIAVADKPGSCALAVYEGRTIECDDVAFDGRFHEGWKHLGLRHGLRALISIPARNGDGSALGTFVVAHAPSTRLKDEVRSQADRVATLCGELLQHRVSQAATC